MQENCGTFIVQHIKKLLKSNPIFNTRCPLMTAYKMVFLNYVVSNVSENCDEKFPKYLTSSCEIRVSKTLQAYTELEQVGYTSIPVIAVITYENYLANMIQQNFPSNQSLDVKTQKVISSFSPYKKTTTTTTKMWKLDLRSYRLTLSLVFSSFSIYYVKVLWGQ